MVNNKACLKKFAKNPICKNCQNKMFAMAMGTCSNCKTSVPSISYQLCAKCAGEKKVCMVCKK